MLKSIRTIQAVALLWGAGGLSAQHITPDAPVKNFILPAFGEDGYRIWELQGREGLYLNEDEIEVTGMTLHTFHPDDPLTPATVIESPQATLFPDSNEARGTEYLYISGEEGNYSIIGRGWHWNFTNDETRIRVFAETRVTFRQSIGNILE